MKTKISVDFQICISVPLNKHKIFSKIAIKTEEIVKFVYHW